MPEAPWPTGRATAEVVELLHSVAGAARERVRILLAAATVAAAAGWFRDGKPALLNFQVREGTYVVPKVLERGYLALGSQRFTFEEK